ncbi:hypothetical protein PIROE2DRAFT_3542 [Piromyces sp. E2]|nr:hypothetical protein PIROE2DRAFT_3542 [Piromyces sp. E2]|eukprot:OUM68697.1 hypothetical protein PIROE2DRAFT_3542 [Piromyces sp. E2]
MYSNIKRNKNYKNFDNDVGKTFKKIKRENKEAIKISLLLTPKDNNYLKKYDYETYIEINNDNEEIEKFMKSIFNKENVDFDKFLGKSLKEVTNSLGKYLYSVDINRKNIEINELDSSQRKLFMICYYIQSTILYSKLNSLIPKKIEDIINQKELKYCYEYNSYLTYYYFFTDCYFKKNKCDGKLFNEFLKLQKKFPRELEILNYTFLKITSNCTT